MNAYLKKTYWLLWGKRSVYICLAPTIPEFVTRDVRCRWYVLTPITLSPPPLLTGFAREPNPPLLLKCLPNKPFYESLPFLFCQCKDLDNSCIIQFNSCAPYFLLDDMRVVVGHPMFGRMTLQVGSSMVGLWPCCDQLFHATLFFWYPNSLKIPLYLTSYTCLL